MYTSVYATVMFCGLFATPAADTWTVAEYTPRAIVFATGAIVRVAGAVVELKFVLCQFVGPPVYETLICRLLSVPRPPLEMVMPGAEAVPMPCVAMKLRDVSDSEISGAGTTNVTGIFSGLFVAVAAVIGTFAVYVPAANEPTVGVSVRVDGVVVVDNDAVSQPVG